MKYLVMIFAPLVFCVNSQAQIATIEARSFYDHRNGIVELVSALESFDASFFEHSPSELDTEFDRIVADCSAPQDTNRKVASQQGIVCHVIKAIADDLQKFAKSKQILVLIDLSYAPAIVDGAPDVTRTFIDDYNRVHH